MLELLLCSMVTILPDYLYRRHAQGKRFGREITIYSVWYELRWGITACLLLTLMLITLIFYYHPSTKAAVSFYRTIPILAETGGRVVEVHVGLRDEVTAGQPLFRLDAARQEADLESARRRIAEVDAAITVARSELDGADARIAEAQSGYREALDELETRQALIARNPNAVSVRDVERAQNVVDGRRAAVEVAVAARASLQAQVTTALPAQRASAEAAVAAAEVELSKMITRAGVDGRVEQFALQVGDIVNPFMRPAGILVPARSERPALEAGFNQIEAQVIRRGMIAEATCIAMPFTIIPMVVTEVQDVIAAGQVRPTDELIDPARVTQPGSLTVYLEPLFPGAIDNLPRGSSCIANAYTNSHEELQDPDIGAARWVFLHVVDTVGIVHAMLLRVQALMLPVRTLVLSGGH